MILSRSLAFVGIAVVIIALFGYLQAVPGWLDPDSFYHVKMAQLIITQSGAPVLDFPWLDQTTLATAFIDQHWLYHELLAVAVRVAGPLLGSIGLTVGLGLLFFVVWWWWLGQAIRPRVSTTSAAVWVVSALAVAEPLIFRLNLAKAGALSLILVFLIWAAAARRRPLVLAALIALYIYSYGGWLMGVVIALVAIGVTAVHRGLVERQWRAGWRELLAQWPVGFGLVGGVAVGLVINPYFPRNLQFYWQQVVQIGIVNYQDSIRVGMEWFPYGFSNLFIGTVLVTIGLVVALATLFVTARRQPVVVWQALALTVFGAAITLRAQRYVEYYLPFAWTFVGLVLLPYLTAAPWRRWYRCALDLPWWQLAGTLLIMVVWLNMASVIVGRDWLKLSAWFHRHYHPITELAGASRWIAANTPPGSTVLHSDWDEFPALWYHNDHNRYIAGLDPTFLYLQSAEKYRLYEDVTMGRRADVAVAASQFGANTVVIKKNDHPAMLAAARQDPALTLTYEDDEAVVFLIKIAEANY